MVGSWNFITTLVILWAVPLRCDVLADNCMSREAFYDGVFELVDLWTQTVIPDECVTFAFLWFQINVSFWHKLLPAKDTNAHAFKCRYASFLKQLRFRISDSFQDAMDEVSCTVMRPGHRSPLAWVAQQVVSLFCSVSVNTGIFSGCRRVNVATVTGAALNAVRRPGVVLGVDATACRTTKWTGQAHAARAR